MQTTRETTAAARGRLNFIVGVLSISKSKIVGDEGSRQGYPNSRITLLFNTEAFRTQIETESLTEHVRHQKTRVTFVSISSDKVGQGFAEFLYRRFHPFARSCLPFRKRACSLLRSTGKCGFVVVRHYQSCGRVSVVHRGCLVSDETHTSRSSSSSNSTVTSLSEI